MYQQVRKSFKLFPTNGLFGSMSHALGQSLHYPITPLLAYVYDALEKYSFALVRSSVFSLVNITSTKQDISVGYSDIDFKDYDDGNLLITFSLVPVPLRKIEVTSKYISLRSHDFLWGREGKGAEYITLTLDQHQLNTLLPETLSLKSLVNIYNVVGLCSKSFVLNPKGWYDSPVYSHQSLESLRGRFLVKSPQFLFRNVPIGYWVYSKVMWQDYSHLIVPSLIDENFYRYFTVNILPVLPHNLNGDSLDWVYRDNKSSYVEYIKKGLLTLLSSWNSGISLNTLTDSEFSVLNLINLLLEESSFYSAEADDEALILYNHFLAITQSEDQYAKSRFLETFTDISGATYKLIISDDQLGTRLEGILNVRSN